MESCSSCSELFERRVARLGLATEAMARQEPVGPLFIDANDDVIRPAIEKHRIWEPGETALLLEWLG